MLKVTRCGDRFLLSAEQIQPGYHPTLRLHMSRKELEKVVRTGKAALTLKRRASACPYCYVGGAD